MFWSLVGLSDRGAAVAVAVQDQRRWHVAVGVEHGRPIAVEGEGLVGRWPTEEDVVERRVVAPVARADQVGVAVHHHGGRGFAAEDGGRRGQVAAVGAADDGRGAVDDEALSTTVRHRGEGVVELPAAGIAEVGPGERLPASDAAARVGQDHGVAGPGERGGAG